MSAKFAGPVTAHSIFLVRSFVVILGCIAVWWGIVVFPGFWQESSTERIANKIIAGDSFKVEILARQHPIVDSIERLTYCYPAALRSAAIVRLHIVESSYLTDNLDQNYEKTKILRSMIRNSLSCSPADPFLWVVLFWLESTHNDVSSVALKYLRMSYELGPHEGWIALKRNPVVIATFGLLPSELADSAINEFAKLVENGFYNEAANILAGPGWKVKNQLLARLSGVKEDRRQSFARLLYERGYDVPVPGIKRLDVR